MNAGMITLCARLCHCDAADARLRDRGADEAADQRV